MYGNEETGVNNTSKRLHELLNTPRIGDLVGRYYEPAGPFAGTSFDELGDNPADRVTRDDLLAVTLLDVRWTPPAVRALSDAAQAGAFAAHLAAIPERVTLWESTDADIDAVVAMWRELQSLRGVGEVTAGKLLARKRPHLVPIADAVTIRVFGASMGEFWPILRECMTDSRLRHQAEAIRPPNASAVTLLRVLDTAAWMIGSRSRNAEAARTALGLQDVAVERWGSGKVERRVADSHPDPKGE